MPDEKAAEEAVVSTPSTQAQAEKLGIPEADFLKMLTGAFQRGVDTARTAAEERFSDRQTNPATRPSMAEATENEEKSLAENKNGLGWTKSDIDHIKEVKAFMPAGTTYKRESTFDGDRQFYKSVNLKDFPKGDVEDNFSVIRLAYAQQRAQIEGPSAWQKYAPWETAYYDAVRKAQAESNGQDGGFLAPEQWVNQLFGILRPNTILDQLPIRRMSVSTRVQHIPRVTGDITIGYTAENGSLTASTFQYSQNTLTPRKQSAFIQISNELMRDSLPDAEQSIRMEAGRAILRDRDKQSIVGNGQAGVPIGLLNMTNVTASSLSAAGPTYINLHTGIKNVELLNGSSNVPTGEASCSGILGPVALKHTIFNLVDVTVGRPIMFQWGVSPVGTVGPAGPVGTNAGLSGFLGVPNWVFTNLLSTTNGMVYGDWQYFILAERQDVEVMASNVAGTAFQNDQTWIRLIYRYDVTCMHPEAFFVHSSIGA